MITSAGRQFVPTPFLIKSWPKPLSDECISSKFIALPKCHEEILSQVETSGDILIRVVTWNQQAKEPPRPDYLARLLFPHKYHLIAFGSQECENSFAKSMFNPSKPKWTRCIEEALGEDYQVLCSHSLQASHIIVFANNAITPLISDVRSVAVATGLGDKLGNKGGISVSFKVSDSSFCFISAHLAAHQHATIRRTNEFRRISNHIVASLLQQKRNSEVSESTSSEEECATGYCDKDEEDDDEEDVTPGPGLPQYSSNDLRTDSGPQLNPLIDVFDKVFWFGDLNFRIYGTREVVDAMLESHMHDALLCCDQLTMLMRFNRVFSGFDEGPLNFFPTYKFDHDSDHYDSSHRRRVPSWTDRILYKKDVNTQVLSYCSQPEIKISDHRPVYATFLSRIQFDSADIKDSTPLWKKRMKREIKSEVCCIS